MTKFTSPETTFTKYGYASYRVEIDLTEPRRPMQRHIWTRDDGSVEPDGWIATICVQPDRLLNEGWTRI